MPRHLISDAHEWINEIPTVPIYYLAKPQPRERAWQNQRGKKTLGELARHASSSMGSTGGPGGPAPSVTGGARLAGQLAGGNTGCHSDFQTVRYPQRGMLLSAVTPYPDRVRGVTGSNACQDIAGSQGSRFRYMLTVRPGPCRRERLSLTLV